MHPIIHHLVLVAAFHLSGPVRCASALPASAVVTNFSSTSCTAMTYSTPQETVLSHFFRKITNSICKRTRSSWSLPVLHPKYLHPPKNATSQPALLPTQEIQSDGSTLAPHKFYLPPLSMPALTPWTLVSVSVVVDNYDVFRKMNNTCVTSLYRVSPTNPEYLVFCVEIVAITNVRIWHIQSVSIPSAMRLRP